MNEYKIVPSIEPMDKYQKAASDLIQAKRSFDELTDAQKNMLIRQLFSVEYIAIAEKIINEINRNH